MSIELLEHAADALGDLTERVAFLGGATIAVWITDPAAPPVRVTIDVDVIVEIGGLTAYYELGEELKSRNFAEDSSRATICAWKHPSGLLLDVMPTDESVLGFGNPWYSTAIETADTYTLPSGGQIQVVVPALLLATKVVAFKARGREDYLASRDFHDMVALIDGRPELKAELDEASHDVRSYLREEFRAMRDHPFFESGVAGALPPDGASQERRSIVLERISAITE